MYNQEEILREKFCEFRTQQTEAKLYKEIPVYSRSVDLVEYNQENKNLTAIEFKIKNWKCALEQLKGVSTCFDSLILCIPKPKTEKCIEKIEYNCRNLGIGLYLWDCINDDFLYECKETQITNIWKVQKEQIIKYIEEQRDYNGR